MAARLMFSGIWQFQPKIRATEENIVLLGGLQPYLRQQGIRSYQQVMLQDGGDSFIYQLGVPDEMDNRFLVEVAALRKPSQMVSHFINLSQRLLATDILKERGIVRVANFDLAVFKGKLPPIVSR